MMKVLITNDDGFDAAGLALLSDALKELDGFAVASVAPRHNRSGVSQALTLDRPLRLEKKNTETWALNGTPADCVMFAFGNLFTKDPPALVISGVNQGLNVGQDVYYSGTLGAAFEASVQGSLAVAISMHNFAKQEKEQLQKAKEIIKHIIGSLIKDRNFLDRTSVLNINLPDLRDVDFKGYKFATIGRRSYDAKFIENIDPRGNKYYWLGAGGDRSVGAKDGSDASLVIDGFVTLSYIAIDRLCISKQQQISEEFAKKLNS